MAERGGMVQLRDELTGAGAFPDIPVIALTTLAPGQGQSMQQLEHWNPGQRRTAQAGAR